VTFSPACLQSGALTVKLSEAVVPTHVTIEHLNKVFSEKGGDSAPKAFTVRGYADAATLEKDVKAAAKAAARAAARVVVKTKGYDVGEEEEGELVRLGVLLAEANYDIDGPNAVQVFPVLPSADSSPAAVSFVRLEVLSNHGNEEYTCLYRMRVH
jgi:SUN domain-containing protein 1/2